MNLILFFKEKKFFTIFYLFLFVLCNRTFALQKGSESTVTVEPLAIFPTEDNDNKMLAFGWFKNGFLLEDNTTSCTFDSVFPVSGSVVFNGGTLYLDSDLHFANVTTITSVGKIYGQNHIVQIDSSVEKLFNTHQDMYFNDVDFFLHSDLQLSTTVIFSGDCYLNGRDRKLYLDSDVEILVGDNSTLTIKNLKLDDISQHQIRCINDTGKIVLDNVEIALDGNYSFTVGQLEIVNKALFSGEYSFFYDSLNTLSVHQNSEFKFADDAVFALGINQVLNKNRAMYFEDRTSKMHLNNAHLNLGSGGVVITRGILLMEGGVNLDIHSTDSVNGLILGDGIEENDPELWYMPATTVKFRNGHFVHNISQPDKMISKSKYSKLVRYAESISYMKTDEIIENLTVELDPASELYTIDDATVHYVNCKIVMSGVKFTITASRYNNHTALLDGGDEVFLEEGTMAMYLLIMNSSNTVGGNGNLRGVITLYDSDAEVNFSLDGSLQNNVVLNGGEVNLNRDLSFGNNASFLTTGTVNISNRDLSFGSKDLTWTSTIYWDGNYGSINLNSDIYLTSNWTFSGDCVINGNNNSLYLLSDGDITVERGSTLEFKNVILGGVKDTKLACLDSEGKMIFDTAKIILDGDYSFTSGGLEILNNVDLSGTYTFFYDSTNTLTIYENSVFRFTDNAVFGLGINTVLDKNSAMYFENKSSRMHMNNAHLSLGRGGVVIIRGTLLMEGGVNLDINSTDSVNSLILGDGTEENDPELWYMSATMVNFRNGHFVYNISQPDKMISKSKYSKLIRYPQSTTYMQTNEILENLTIELDPASQLYTIDGATVHYVGCKIIMPGVKFTITGSRYNNYTTLLGGNDEVFLEEGTLAMYFLVMNAGNIIRGSGSLTGLISLYDSDAELSFGLDGSLLNNIDLNGGKIILDYDLEFGNDATLVSTGTVNLNDKDLTLGAKDLVWTSTVYWDGNYGRIDLNSNIYLTSNWTFSGNCIINGNNNIIYFMSDGNITLERGSTLEFKNVRLSGLRGTNLQCQDSAGKIIFDTVTTKLMGDYYFQNGSFEVDYKFDIKGRYTFCYQSDQVSTINNSSTLKLFCDSSFSYDPSVANGGLIQFTACESYLELEGASLHSSCTGMQFTCGVLRINGNCFLDSDATCKAEAVCFGDGVDADHNVEFDVLAESTLELRSGYLCYKNVD